MTPSKQALDQICKVLRTTASTISDAFEEGWPSKNNEITESNLVLHLGRELLNKSYRCYTEIQVDGKPRQHFDLVAVGSNPKWILVAEAKILWSGNQARKLGDDWNRLKKRRISPYVVGQTSGYHCFGALLSMTHREEFSDWWTCKQRPSRPSHSRIDSPWKQLGEGLKKADWIPSAKSFERPASYYDCDTMFINVAVIKFKKDQFTGQRS